MLLRVQLEYGSIEILVANEAAAKLKMKEYIDNGFKIKGFVKTKV